jgi:hypothetical protein
LLRWLSNVRWMGKSEPFESLGAAAGRAGQVGPGPHTRLVADPGGSREVTANPVTAAQAARVARTGRAFRSRRIGAGGPVAAIHAGR